MERPARLELASRAWKALLVPDEAANCCRDTVRSLPALPFLGRRALNHRGYPEESRLLALEIQGAKKNAPDLWFGWASPGNYASKAPNYGTGKSSCRFS